MEGEGFVLNVMIVLLDCMVGTVTGGGGPKMCKMCDVMYGWSLEGPLLILCRFLGIRKQYR